MTIFLAIFFGRVWCCLVGLRDPMILMPDPTSCPMQDYLDPPGLCYLLFRWIKDSINLQFFMKTTILLTFHYYIFQGKGFH